VEEDPGTAAPPAPTTTSPTAGQPAPTAARRTHHSGHSAYQTNPQYPDDATNDSTTPILPISVTLRSPGLSKRDVPFLPGNIFCPESGADITSGAAGSDVFFYSDATADDPDIPDDPVLVWRRALEVTDTNENSTFSEDPFKVLAKSANLQSCKTLSIPIPDYDTTPIIAWYDLEDPALLDAAIEGYVPFPPAVTLGPNGQPVMTAPSPNPNSGPKPVYARYCTIAQPFSSLMCLKGTSLRNFDGYASYLSFTQPSEPILTSSFRPFHSLVLH
jgi:hypothetical protein